MFSPVLFGLRRKTNKRRATNGWLQNIYIYEPDSEWWSEATVARWKSSKLVCMQNRARQHSRGKCATTEGVDAHSANHVRCETIWRKSRNSSVECSSDQCHMPHFNIASGLTTTNSQRNGLMRSRNVSFVRAQPIWMEIVVSRPGRIREHMHTIGLSPARSKIRESIGLFRSSFVLPRPSTRCALGMHNCNGWFGYFRVFLCRQKDEINEKLFSTDTTTFRAYFAHIASISGSGELFRWPWKDFREYLTMILTPSSENDVSHWMFAVLCAKSLPIPFFASFSLSVGMSRPYW